MLLQKRLSPQYDPSTEKKADIGTKIVEAVEQLTGVQVIKQLSEPPTPAPSVIDPGQLVKDTLVTAKEMSKDEREERKAAEERARQEREKADKQQQESAVHTASVQERLEQERFEHQKDLLSAQVTEMQRIANEIRESKTGGEAPTGKIREFTEGITALQEMMVTLAPKRGEEKKTSPVEEMTAWMMQYKQLSELMGINKPNAQQLVNMGDTTHLPVDVAIAFKRLDLEDARLKEEGKTQEAQAERQHSTQEAIIALVMGIGTRFLDSLQAQEESTPRQVVRREITRSPDQTVEVECDQCHGVFLVAVSDKDKTLECPHCGRTEGNEPQVT